MSNIQNKIAYFVNFNKHKKRIYSYTHYYHRGMLLHLKQNNLTYNSTGKNITVKIFTTTQIQIENKTIYHSINTKKITTNLSITIKTKITE